MLSVLKPGDKMLCSEKAHLLKYEYDAIKILGSVEIDTLHTVEGKIDVQCLENTLRNIKCSLLSITQPTEVGSVYTLDELEQIYKIASENGVLVHIDGARFFYAVNYLQCSPNQILKQCNMLTLGLTKFGSAFGDLLIVKEDSLISKLSYLQHLFSQMIPRKKLILRQIETFFSEGINVFSSKYAHDLAVSMKNRLIEIGVDILYPVQANLLYLQLTKVEIHELLKYYKLAISSGNSVRVVISYAITERDVQEIISVIKLIRLTNLD
jgi:threonine aldolase